LAVVSIKAKTRTAATAEMTAREIQKAQYLFAFRHRRRL
jgi:hypothetical protein